MLYLHKRRARGRHGILTHKVTHTHTCTYTRSPPKAFTPLVSKALSPSKKSLRTSELTPKGQSGKRKNELREQCERMLSDDRGEETRKCWKREGERSLLWLRESQSPPSWLHEVLHCLVVVIECNYNTEQAHTHIHTLAREGFFKFQFVVSLWETQCSNMVTGIQGISSSWMEVQLNKDLHTLQEVALYHTRTTSTYGV